MDSDSRTGGQGNGREEDRGGILRRIEEKLDRLLRRRDDDWHEREWAPLDSPFAYYDAGDPSPRFFGGPRADAPGWDPSIAGPRFDRIDVGAVGTHGVDPVSSFDGARTPLFTAHSSAREYYLLRRARGRAYAGDGATGYADYRRRKKAELDREYADYCRDQQARFDRDFDAWREKRSGPSRSVDKPARREETAAEDEAKRR
ncbi:MAG TPA: hypothetical protein VHU79_06580 [Sphingomicrobium sp.]|jgi:hypothetical protein|nr:hypothetical protein [Sphingomicrobium sp.]